MSNPNQPVSTFLDALAVGRTSSSPFVDQISTVDPTSNDTIYQVQQKWLNTTTGTFWELQNFYSSNGVVFANWVKIGSVQLVESLTGNTGGAVFPVPVGSNNINVVGDGTYIKTVGTPLTGTLTIEPAGGLTTLYTENTGTATPSSGNLNVLGGTGINTVGAGSTITINATSVALNYTNVTHAMSPYTVLSTDAYISVDCSLGVVTLKFPNAPTTYRVLEVKDRTGNSGTNNITVTTVGGSVDIDGQTSLTMDSNYMSLGFLFNGTTYEVF